MPDFKSQITQFSAKQILAAFPGMPPSTAYGWQKGLRSPPEWLQTTIVATVKANTNKTEDPAVKDHLPEWFLNWLLDNPIPKTEDIQGPIYEWVLAKFEEHSDKIVESLPSFLEGWSRQNLKEGTLKPSVE